MGERVREPERSSHHGDGGADLAVAISEGSVGAVLEHLAHLVKNSVPGVDEASVMVMDEGTPRSVAFTGALAVHLDERQYESGAGPCLDAAASGAIIRIPDMATETTYAEFAHAARRQGVTHTLSVGLPIGGTSVGGLNLYSLGSEPFDDPVIDLVSRYADYAAVAVAAVAAAADATAEVAGLRTAMSSRAVIEQAKGILMRDQRCTEDEAFKLLVQASNQSNRKVRDIARSLVDGTRH